jgi:hypothetical protein
MRVLIHFRFAKELAFLQPVFIIMQFDIHIYVDLTFYCPDKSDSPRNQTSQFDKPYTHFR